MKVFLRAFAALSIMAAATSCADKKDENIYDVAQRSFDAWMKKHEPTATRYSNGLYIKWLVRNPDGAKPVYGNWIMLNYTGRSLNGDVFKTRIEDVAKQENTWTIRTNYVPAYLSYSEYGNLTDGENFAIGQMRQGEKAIVYMPSKLGYNGVAQSFSNGYEGNYIISSAMIPIQVELELTDIITDASAREKELVEKCLAANGMSTDDKIEGKEGLYAKVLTKHTTEPNEDEGGLSKVGKDDDIYIYRDVYAIQDKRTGKMLEGEPNEGDDFGLFLVHTDRIALADAKWNDFTPYQPVFLRPSASSETIVYAIRGTFLEKEITYKSSFMVITTSSYTYGENGNASVETSEPYGEIPPYTPLLIKVYVERKNYEPGDELLTDFGTPVE